MRAAFLHREYRPPAARRAGFSYVGVLVALLLLAICAAPAADAVRNAVAAPEVSARQLGAVLCLKSRMESLMAEPYQNLLLASGAPGTAAPAYSLPADGSCPARQVYISKLNLDAGGNPSYPAVDTGLLSLIVAIPDTAGAATLSFSTVVTR